MSEKQSKVIGIEVAIERILFGSRWLLAPVYLGLVAGMLILVVKFVQAFWHTVTQVASITISETTLAILELLDIALLTNLILIVVFSGYENFVSKINVAKGSEDRPTWMGKVDFSGLKIKLIGSLVAISVIELLKDFLDPAGIDPEQEFWLIAIHLTFVVSGVLFAVMDYIADKRSIIDVSAKKQEIELEQMAKKEGMTKEQLAAVDPMGE